MILLLPEIGAVIVAKRQAKEKQEKTEKTEKTSQKKDRKKTVLVAVVCLFLIVSIVFSIYMLLKSRKLSADDGEKYNPVFLPGDVKIICDMDANPGAALAEASRENSEDQENPEDQETEASDSSNKQIDWSQDPAARYEIIIGNARQLSAAEKESYGLSKETGRLAALELDMRLLDTSYDWNFYNRKIQDNDGNWLDELKAITNQELLDKGQQDKQTLIIRLSTAEANAKVDELITLYIYTTSWNAKEKADGQCQITVTPPAPDKSSSDSGPGSAPVIRNADTEFGQWTGNTYSSSQLNMSITLPENWQLQPATLRETNDKKSIEGSAVRSDNQASFQLSVNKDVGATNENDQINFFTNLLGKAVGKYTVGQPFHFTIAGKEYMGLTYSYDDVSHQIYFYKDGNDIIEVALRFPYVEGSGAEQFLSGMKSLS